MEMLLIGIALGLTIGFCCRWFDIPLPSPPNLVGALLVVAMTLGFVSADYILQLAPPNSLANSQASTQANTQESPTHE